MRPMRRRRDRAITLILTLMVILSLLGLGTTALWLTSMGMRAAGNINSRQAALNAAQAGVQHARRVLVAYATSGATSCTSNPSAPWSCALAGRSNAKDRLQTTAAPGAIGAILYDGATALDGLAYPAVSCASASDCSPTESCTSGRCAPTLGSYTVWVRNDPSDINAAAAASSSMAVDGNGSVIVRSEGRDVHGSVVVVEAAITRFATAGSGPPNLSYGKNVDQYGSNSVSGAVSF